MFPEYPDIVSTRQLAEILGISESHASSLIRKGKIPAIKVGGRYQIPKVNIINYVVENRAKRKRKKREK